MYRKTSVYERFLFHYSGKGPMYFAFRMILRGPLNAQNLQTALKKTRVEYPLSAVRMYKDEQHNQFITTDDVPDYPLTVISNFDGDPSEEIVKMLQTPFDHAIGPMARFALLHTSNEHHLITVFHHAICDGVAASIFIERLLEHLADPDLEAIAPGEANWAPELHKLISPENLEKILSFDPPEFKENKDYIQYEVKEVKQKPFPKPAFRLHHASFSVEETQRIIAATKEKGVTVHAYIGAHILRCFAEMLGPEKGYTRTIQSPINFRPQLKNADKTFGLFNGIITVTTDCSSERPLSKIASDIGTGMHNQIESLEPLKKYHNFMSYWLDGVQNPEEYFDNRPQENDDDEDENDEVTYDFSFSNLGRTSFQTKYGDLTLDAVYGPTFSATRGERVIGALTMNGQLFMTMIYDAECFAPEKGDHVWTAIQEALRGQA